MANVARLVALLFVMTLVASGYSTVAEPAVATGPVPLMPEAIAMSEWSYTYRGEAFTEPGEWMHLPTSEAGNLLL